MSNWSLRHVPDDVLLRDLVMRATQERGATAQVLLHIAEVDERGLYRAAAFPSMQQYCIGELHMSEAAAWKRWRAACTARRFPVIFEMIADGRLHLSGVCLLAPRLTSENAAALLAAAVHKTKSEIELVLAEHFPAADTPTSLTEVDSDGVPEAAEGQGSLPLLEAEESERESKHAIVPGRMESKNTHLANSAPASSSDTTHAVSSNAPTACAPSKPAARVAPLSPGRFELRTTLDQETHDLLQALKALMSHSIPSGNVPELLKHALRLAVRDAERRKYAKTDRPRKSQPAANATSKKSGKKVTKRSRYIPAPVRREVRERDGDQCTFVSATGRRCAEKRFLEIDHVKLFALGGEAKADDLRLRCRAHNQYTAEQAFGREHMDAKRAEHRQREQLRQ